MTTTNRFIRDGYVKVCPHCDAPDPIALQSRQLTSMHASGDEKVTTYIDKWCRICESKITEVHIDS